MEHEVSVVCTECGAQYYWPLTNGELHLYPTTTVCLDCSAVIATKAAFAAHQAYYGRDHDDSVNYGPEEESKWLQVVTSVLESTREP